MRTWFATRRLYRLLTCLVLLALMPTTFVAATAEETDAIPNYNAQSVHTCVNDPITQHHGQVIFAYPIDIVPDLAVAERRIRIRVAQAQDRLDASAKRVRADLQASYYLACTPDLQVSVIPVQLPTLSTADSYATIKRDLLALGYNKSNVMYWVDFAGRGTTTGCGESDGRNLDDSAAETNVHNQGPRFAVNYAGSLPNATCNSLHHEVTHAMGVAQPSMPHFMATDPGHLTDPADLMAGNAGTIPGTCAVPLAEAFDCGNDDYFNPLPAAGSYLATHWNLGACYQRWIALNTCPNRNGTITYDSASPMITYTGTWLHRTSVPNAMGQTLSTTNEAASARLTFTGQSVTVFFSYNPSGGSFKIKLDGQMQPLYRSTDRSDTLNQVGIPFEFDTPGQHTIEVIHPAEIPGSISIDAFAVNIARVGTGSYDNTHQHVRYSGAWSHVTPAPNAFNDTLSWSRTPTEVIRFTFVGSALRYVYDKAPNRGLVAITIDGSWYHDLDLYAESTQRQVETRFADFDPGLHVVTIAPTGRRNLGTQSYITLDRFIVEP